MVRLFEEHKRGIVEILAPYLRTYDGADYAEITIAAYGKPLPPDGRKVAFHVSVHAEMGPADDEYSAGLVLDPVEVDTLMTTRPIDRSTNCVMFLPMAVVTKNASPPAIAIQIPGPTMRYSSWAIHAPTLPAQL